MSARSCPALVLIIDDDLGFLMWLGAVFHDLECQPIPALHCRQAVALVERFDLPIATLVVNPELRGATRAVQRVRASNPNLRVILICDSNSRLNRRHPRGRNALPRGIRAPIALQRPSPEEPISRAEWVEKIRKILHHYPAT